KKVPPMFTWFQLAHAYESSGDIDTAIQQWLKDVDRGEQEMVEKAKGPASRAHLDAAVQHVLQILHNPGTTEEDWNKALEDLKKVPPMFTWFQLAHAYESSGDIDTAIQQWLKDVDRGEQEMVEKAKGPASRAHLDAAVQHVLQILHNPGTTEEDWNKALEDL